MLSTGGAGKAEEDMYGPQHVPFPLYNNISMHRLTGTPHNIYVPTLSNAQKSTHTAYAQHSHRSLRYTHRHVSAQIPVSIHTELGHLCRGSDLWHALISSFYTEPGPQPQPSAALLVVIAKYSLKHISILSRVPPIRGGWGLGHDSHSHLLMTGHLYGTSPMARTCPPPTFHPMITSWTFPSFIQITSWMDDGPRPTTGK